MLNRENIPCELDEYSSLLRKVFTKPDFLALGDKYYVSRLKRMSSWPICQ